MCPCFFFGLDLRLDFGLSFFGFFALEFGRCKPDVEGGNGDVVIFVSCKEGDSRGGHFHGLKIFEVEDKICLYFIDGAVDTERPGAFSLESE